MDPKIQVRIESAANLKGFDDAKRGAEGVKTASAQAGDALKNVKAPTDVGLGGIAEQAAKAATQLGGVKLDSSKISAGASAAKAAISSIRQTANALKGDLSAVATSIGSMLQLGARGGVWGIVAAGVASLGLVVAKLYKDFKSAAGAIEDTIAPAERLKAATDKIGKDESAFGGLLKALDNVRGGFEKAISQADRLRAAQNRLDDAKLALKKAKIDVEFAPQFKAAEGNEVLLSEVQMRYSEANAQAVRARDLEKAESEVKVITKEIADRKQAILDADARHHEIQRSAERYAKHYEETLAKLAAIGVENVNNLATDEKARKAATETLLKSIEALGQVYDEARANGMDNAELFKIDKAVTRNEKALQTVQEVPGMAAERDRRSDAAKREADGFLEAQRSASGAVRVLMTELATTKTELEKVRTTGYLAVKLEAEAAAKSLSGLEGELMNAKAYLAHVTSVRQTANGPNAVPWDQEYNYARSAVAQIEAQIEAARRAKQALDQSAQAVGDGLATFQQLPGQATAAGQQVTEAAGAAAADLTGATTTATDAMAGASGTIGAAISSLGSAVQAMGQKTSEQIAKVVEAVEANGAAIDKLGRRVASVEADAGRIARETETLKAQVRNR